MTYLGELKDFQITGCDFLFKKRRAICAYDVGLGKTHIAIAVNEKLKELRGISRTLVVCPNYLKWKWANELIGYTDSPFSVLDGVPASRKVIIEEYKEGYFITNYELLRQDYKDIFKLDFEAIIADEVTKIKSYNSKTKQTLNKFRPDYRFGLTGTPISNKPDELYSIMGWIDGNLFGKWIDFDRNYIVRNHFGGVSRYINLRDLAEITSERMISMTQEEAGGQLPEVIIETIPVPFTAKQKKLYDEVASSLEEYLDTMVSKMLSEEKITDEEARIRERFNSLRMVSISPLLLKDSNSKFNEALLPKCNDPGGKLQTLFEIIDEKIVGTKDKMVVFSFYRNILPLIAEYLDLKAINYRLLMGGMDAKETQEKIMEFTREDNVQMFLTTEAGDKGIDLQAAKYLVNMDIPFSWEKYEQRLGRIKRIGSKHTHAIVYNLVMMGSFEERQLQIVNRKGELSEAIRGKLDIDMVVPSDQSLRQFLKGE